MGGPFPTPGNPGSLAYQLAKLVQSPRVQYLKSDIKRILPMTSGPLRTKLPANKRGATPRVNNAPNVPNLGGISQIGGILSQLGPAIQQANDPMAQLYANLLDQLQAPVQMPTGINTEDLMNQVQAAINPIYDQRARAAEEQSARATKDVQSMYGALAKDYERLAPEQIAQAQEAQQEVEQLYGQLRSNITGTFSRVSKEQGDLFKQLGIEAALPDVLAEQQGSVMDAATAASENQAQQQQRYMDIGQMDSTFYREGSPNSIARGNEVATDFLAQLQDYLGQVEAERSSGIQTAYLDQLGQAQSNLAQQQQYAQSEAARRQEMLWGMLQQQMQAGQQAQNQPLTPDSYMSQLSPQLQQSVAGAFTQLQRSPEAVYGKVEDPRNPVPGSFVETTPQWYLSQADKMYQSGAIDPATYQNLLMYIQLYYGMGK